MKTLLSAHHTPSAIWKRGAISLLIFLGALRFVPTLLVEAQTPPPDQPSAQVELFVEPAFEGQFKYGEWLPIFVELTNRGPDLEAEVRLPVLTPSDTLIFSMPVELPAGAKKRLTLYVLPNNFSRQLDLELVANGDPIASRRIQVSPNPNANLLVGLISSQRGALSLLHSIEIPGIPRPKVLIDIALDQIPERSEGLRSFDVLILNDIDTSQLSTAQRTSLESWVHQGGSLVVGGGSNSQLTAAGLPQTLFPGQVLTTFEIENLSGLEAYSDPARPVRVPGPFIAAELKTDSGQTLAGDEAMPLLQEWTVGQGRVNFIALDLAAAPFDSWNGAQNFWENLLSARLAYPDWMPVDIGARQQFASSMPYALQNLPILDMPSARSLAVMLVIYILFVGPVNYLVLKRAKRLHLAWITIPALTLIFSALAFGLGVALHGTDIFINKISILQLEPSGGANYTSFVGVFSPAQTSYQVEVSGSGLISPMSPYYEPWMSSVPPGSSAGSGRTLTLVQGEPALVKGLSVDQWSMQSFLSEGFLPEIGGVAHQLILENDRLTGSLTNQTGMEVVESYLILNQKFQRLGPIPAGGTAEVVLDLSSLGSPIQNTSLSYAMFEKELNQTAPGSDRRMWESRRAIVESIFERTPPYFKFAPANGALSGSAQTPIFIGWVANAPPAVRILDHESTEQTSAVILTSLNYTLPDNGIISIPVGMIAGQLSSAPREGGSCGMPGTTGVYIQRGEAIFDYTLPTLGFSYNLETLRFGIWTDTGFFTPPNIEFFDWEAGEWVPLSGIAQGINLLPKAKPLVSRDGRIQIRLSTDSGQGCYFLALGAEGSQR